MESFEQDGGIPRSPLPVEARSAGVNNLCVGSSDSSRQAGAGWGRQYTASSVSPRPLRRRSAISRLAFFPSRAARPMMLAQSRDLP